MELNNIIFLIFLLFLGYFVNKYLLLILKKKKTKLLLDDQFKKIQAFHYQLTYRIGGITFFFLFAIVSLYLFSYKNIFLAEYLAFASLFFFLGLFDDLKIYIPPKFRLLAMIGILIFLIIQNEFYIEKSGLKFLNDLLSIDIFALIFMCLCFLFIINGSNLIDGFNGLLGIHASIIFIVLFAINIITGNSGLAYTLFYLLILTLIFLKFNFPKAQMFLGDSGAYLVGAFIAVSVINTSILNPSISPFFFCILLFYLFFEVFFSFFRKLFIVRQSPLFPDKKHLHMLLYKLLLKKNKSRLISNYTVSIYLNLIYLLILIPGIFFMKDGLFCRYYFFLILIFYISFYKLIYKKVI